ncbi:MAG: chlorophyll synthase ChlG [Gammaproteobacteria bacterium]|nr:chlorophyll synthase ChlG [Gammaproteobacteria bacterium]
MARSILPVDSFTSSMPSLSATLALLKPVTWFPPMWAFACGAVCVGTASADALLLALGGILLAGPLICGTSQAVNDWFDREVDAINEPQRPIPSGRVPGHWGLYIAVLWTGLSLLWAILLGSWVVLPAALGLLLAWVYSAPPLRLKRSGWIGPAVVALCYEGLPWLTAAILLSGEAPGGRLLAIALLYSVGAHGIMTLNDFKSVEGDRATGIRSLPATLGPERAARIACAVMFLPQTVVVYLLWQWDGHGYAGLVALMLLMQICLAPRLLRSPRDNAAWYSATGVGLYVTGMMIGAFALRHLNGG